MAKFLQDTIEEMAVTAKKKKTQEVVSEFANFFEKVSATLHVEAASLFEKWSDMFQIAPYKLDLGGASLIFYLPKIVNNNSL